MCSRLWVWSLPFFLLTFKTAVPAAALSWATAINLLDKGSLVYLNGADDLSVPLSKVEAAGGSILLEKTSIGPNGFMAKFLDTEGNKVAFHSIK